MLYEVITGVVGTVAVGRVMHEDDGPVLADLVNPEFTSQPLRIDPVEVSRSFPIELV